MKLAGNRLRLIGQTLTRWAQPIQKSFRRIDGGWVVADGAADRAVVGLVAWAASGRAGAAAEAENRVAATQTQA